MKMYDANNSTTMSGRVKWFDARKDFGFIQPLGSGPDVLLHGNVLRRFGQNSILDGSVVEVLVQTTEHGLQAREILSQQLPQPHDPDIPTEVTEITSVELEQLPLMPARAKWYDNSRGFGFAQCFKNPDDIFIHKAVLNSAGLNCLDCGEAVGLRYITSTRGKFAVQIQNWIS